MSFSIKFVDESVPDGWLQPGEKALLGEITIHDFRERLKISTLHWSKQDYIKHWAEAGQALLSRRVQETILCTDVADTTKVGYSVGFWALYRDGDRVLLHNMYEPSNGHIYSTDLGELLKLVPEKIDEGSEWMITLDDLQEWVESLEV